MPKINIENIASQLNSSGDLTFTAMDPTIFVPLHGQIIVDQILRDLAKGKNRPFQLLFFEKSQIMKSAAT